MNWLDAFLTVADVVSEMTAFIRGFGMDTEYVPLIALLLLAGGVVFWIGVVFMFFVGMFRLVRRGVWAVIDLVPVKGSGGSMPQRD